MKSYMKIIQLLCILFFMGVLLTPLINSRLKIIDEIKGNENRGVTKKPVFNINRLDDFTKNYDIYYTDNFSLRQNFISIVNRLDYLLFNVSPVPQTVTIGKDGWFYATKSAQNYKGANLFSKEELNYFKIELEERTKWAKDHGCEYYLIVVPNKMNVYPEYLPNNIIKISNKTRYDQIVSLDKYDGINVVGIKDNIVGHKNDGHELYQRTDDHWNDLGAYYGYQEIMNRLSIQFPELNPIPLSNYEISISKKTGAMTRMINLENSFPEHFVELTNIKPSIVTDGQITGYPVMPNISTYDSEFVKINEKGANITCLIIRDSFTMFLIKYFQEHFNKSIYFHDGWLYRLREDIIEKEKPKIVLNIILETELRKLIENPFVKTADMFYYELTSQKDNIEQMKKRAKNEGISVDRMNKLVTLWLYNDRLNNGKRMKETLLYYEFLFETSSEHKKEVEKYANQKSISFIEASKELAKYTYEKSLKK